MYSLYSKERSKLVGSVRGSGIVLVQGAGYLWRLLFGSMTHTQQRVYG